jgi:hypothetical protein
MWFHLVIVWATIQESDGCLKTLDLAIMSAETPWRSLALIPDKKGPQKGPHKTGK